VQARRDQRQHPVAVGVQDGIYCKNAADGARAARDPALNIWVHHNVMLSTDAANNFEGAVWFHGIDGGFDGVKIERNRATVLTKTGSAVPGAIGFVSTNAQGRLDHVEVVGNEIEDIGHVHPDGHLPGGRLAAAFADNVTFGAGNRVKNFFYPYRTFAACSASITGISGVEQDSCTSAPLIGTAEAFRLPRVIYGTTPPIAGLQPGRRRGASEQRRGLGHGQARLHHGGRQQRPTSGRPGRPTTVGDWIRNASGRVYKVTTAPGAPTSTVAPSGTTVGGPRPSTATSGSAWPSPRREVGAGHAGRGAGAAGLGGAGCP
jgi:hypothetical protein